MCISCYIFDLGGVCFTNGTDCAIDKYWLQYGIEKQLSVSALCGDDSVLFRMGKISVVEFWNRAKIIMKTDIPWEELQEVWNSSYEINYEVVGVIDTLRKNGGRVLFLSNNTKNRMEYLEFRYGIRNHFDEGLLSCDENSKKPDLNLYYKILEIAGVPAKKCLYIDDNEDFLVPAKKIGMNTLHFTTHKDLTVFLKEQVGIEI